MDVNDTLLTLNETAFADNCTFGFNDSLLETMSSLCLPTVPGGGWTTVVAKTARKKSSFTMTWWQQLGWTTIFTLMLIVAIGGNTIVIWIVLAHRRMRTVTNYFLVNLSVADLSMAVFNCSFNFIYMINRDWTYGETYCTFNNFIANVSVAASVFTLTGISCDRYLAIVRPLKPRMSKTWAQVAIVIIWLASIALGSPCLVYSSTYTFRNSGKTKTACIIIWPDGLPNVSTLDSIYNVVLLLTTYLVPMCAMVVCYTSMGKELWGSRSIGEMTQRQSDSIRSKRKVVRMFVVIVTIFGVCWLPYHGYFIYTNINSSVTYSKYVQHIYLGFYWLAMSNSMVNPLIYYWMNARFRQYFKDAICVWRCLQRSRRRQDGGETPPLPRHRNSSSRSRSGGNEKLNAYGAGGRHHQCRGGNACCNERTRLNHAGPPRYNQYNHMQNHVHQHPQPKSLIAGQPNYHRNVLWDDSNNTSPASRGLSNNNGSALNTVRCGIIGHSEWCILGSGVTTTSSLASANVIGVGSTQFTWRRDKGAGVASASV